MPRSRPEGRLDELVAAAARVFTRAGLRRAQMVDVARELGVSAGSLYGYVESKDALFDLVVRRAFLADAPGEPELPIATPPPGELAAHLRARVEGAIADFLAEPLAAELPDRETIAAEVTTVLRELYDFLDVNREGIRLIDRTAGDRPDLAKVYYAFAREELIVRLTRYLDARTQAGLLHAHPSVDATARAVLETTSWFAVHRHYDFGPSIFSETDARENTISLLARGLCKETT